MKRQSTVFGVTLRIIILFGSFTGQFIPKFHEFKQILVKYQLDTSKVDSENVKKFYNEFKKIRFVYKYLDLYNQEESDEFNFGDNFHLEDKWDEV